MATAVPPTNIPMQQVSTTPTPAHPNANQGRPMAGSLAARLAAAPPVQVAQRQQTFTDDEKRGLSFKFKGYPEFVNWMSKSEDFCIVRRFTKLDVRVLLDMQDQIVLLEEELQRIDEGQLIAYFDKTSQGLVQSSRNDTLRNDPSVRRREILTDLRPLLKEYNDFFLAFSEMRSRLTADDRQVKNLHKWLFNNWPGAIDPEETKWVAERKDLVSILTKDKSPLRRLVEKSRRIRFWSLFKARTWEKSSGEPTTTHLYSGRGLNAFTNIIIMGLGLCMLFGPMWWLNFVTDDNKRLGIITGFTFLFTVVLICSTVEKPFEVLAGTAAYAAVLMVFMQASSGSPSQPAP